jgi:hypothetical protein
MVAILYECTLRVKWQCIGRRYCRLETRQVLHVCMMPSREAVSCAVTVAAQDRGYVGATPARGYRHLNTTAPLDDADCTDANNGHHASRPARSSHQASYSRAHPALLHSLGWRQPGCRGLILGGRGREETLPRARKIERSQDRGIRASERSHGVDPASKTTGRARLALDSD